MIRTLALLCLIAAPALGTFTSGFKRTFSLDFPTWGNNSFVDMPRNIISANNQSWVEKTGPARPEGYESLLTYCLQNDNSLCILYDPKSGNVTGLQYAIKQKRFVPMYDMNTLGFSNWTSTENGTSYDYYYICHYYMSPETLSLDPASRIDSDKDTIVKGDLWLTGFYGELFNVSTNTAYITDNSTSPYTKQACIMFMGHHYYYNMTDTLECTAKTLFPWFPLIYDDQLIGVGLMIIGAYNSSSDAKPFESPSESMVKLIVPNAPECFYTSAGKGVLTIHVYFIEKVVTSVLCLLESWFG